MQICKTLTAVSRSNETDKERSNNINLDHLKHFFDFVLIFFYSYIQNLKLAKIAGIMFDVLFSPFYDPRTIFSVFMQA